MACILCHAILRILPAAASESGGGCAFVLSAKLCGAHHIAWHSHGPSVSPCASPKVKKAHTAPLKDRYPQRIASVYHEALRWWNPSTMHQWDRHGTRKNATALTPTRGHFSHHSPGACPSQGCHAEGGRVLLPKQLWRAWTGSRLLPKWDSPVGSSKPYIDRCDAYFGKKVHCKMVRPTAHNPQPWAHLHFTGGGRILIRRSRQANRDRDTDRDLRETLRDCETGRGREREGRGAEFALLYCVVLLTQHSTVSRQTLTDNDRHRQSYRQTYSRYGTSCRRGWARLGWLAGRARPGQGTLSASALCTQKTPAQCHRWLPPLPALSLLAPVLPSCPPALSSHAQHHRATGRPAMPGDPLAQMQPSHTKC